MYVRSRRDVRENSNDNNNNNWTIKYNSILLSTPTLNTLINEMFLDKFILERNTKRRLSESICANLDFLYGGRVTWTLNELLVKFGCLKADMIFRIQTLFNSIFSEQIFIFFWKKNLTLIGYKKKSF